MTIGGCSALIGSEFGDGHLEIGQHFEQKGLERLVRAVELVDQEDRRAPPCRGLERLQQRPLDQIALGKEVAPPAGRGRRTPPASASRIAIICPA